MSTAPLKIIEPMTKPVREFANPEAFMKFYTKHADEINDKNTVMLNKMYNIEGYHIGRRKGEIVLNKWCGYNKFYVRKTVDVVAGSEDRVTALEEKLEQLTTIMNEIINRINNL
jgi:hypothetical protein